MARYGAHRTVPGQPSLKVPLETYMDILCHIRWTDFKSKKFDRQPKEFIYKHQGNQFLGTIFFKLRAVDYYGKLAFTVIARGKVVAFKLAGPDNFAHSKINAAFWLHGQRNLYSPSRWKGWMKNTYVLTKHED